VLVFPSHDRFGMNVLVGYTYARPEALDPDYVYAVDNQGNELTQTASTSLLSNTSTAADTAAYRSNPVLKYRFEHLVNADVEFVFTVKKKHKLAVGLTYRYYSFMRSVDKIFYEVDPIFGWGAVDFRENNSNGDHVFDLRASAELTENIKVAVVMKNVANRIYALRPLKVNAPRTTQLQLTVQF